MKSKRFLRLLAVVGTAVAGGSELLVSADAPPAYLDAKRPIEERVDDLVDRMTLEEKVGQLNLPCVYVEELGKDIPAKREACRRFAAGFFSCHSVDWDLSPYHASFWCAMCA